MQGSPAPGGEPATQLSRLHWIELGLHLLGQAGSRPSASRCSRAPPRHEGELLLALQEPRRPLRLDGPSSGRRRPARSSRRRERPARAARLHRTSSSSTSTRVACPTGDLLLGPARPEGRTRVDAVERKRLEFLAEAFRAEAGHDRGDAERRPLHLPRRSSAGSTGPAGPRRDAGLPGVRRDDPAPLSRVAAPIFPSPSRRPAPSAASARATEDSRPGPARPGTCRGWDRLDPRTKPCAPRPYGTVLTTRDLRP